MNPLLLKRARLTSSTELVDIQLSAGRITAIAKRIDQHDGAAMDLGGRVVLPGLVDAHTHLDKTFSSLENRSGTLQEALAVWQRVKGERSLEEVRQAIEKALSLATQNGVTALRSHIDLADESDLPLFELMLAIRSEWQDRITLQWVALGQPGEGDFQDALMTTVLEMGCDLIGGAPALTADPNRAIDAGLTLAARSGRSVDFHIDETEDPRSLTLEYLAEQTIQKGLQGRVTAGHCCSLGFVAAEVRDRVIDKVAQAQINIVTLPSCNLVLMGRQQHPAPRGITPVRDFLAAGVNVCAASDNVRDPFNPFGRYDPLQIANLNAHAAHMSGLDGLSDSLQMVTSRAAHTMGLGGYGLTAGADADLVILDTTDPLDAVLAVPPRHAVFKGGLQIGALDGFLASKSDLLDGR